MKRKGSIPSRVVNFINGPFAEKQARLSGAALYQTAQFTSSGMTGCYKRVAYDRLKWEAA